jgi:Putative metallopeptidase
MRSRRGSGFDPCSNITRHGLLVAGAALGILLLGAAPISAQPAAPAVPTSSTLQQRIEAAAKAIPNSPRLEGLTEQQRIDRVEFVAGNTLVLLLHELGHAHIAEMHLPVLGREEDEADTFAALRLLIIGTSFSQHELAEAVTGWFLNDRRDQDTGEKPLYYDEHNLSQQRAYQILCLMVGSDPVKFKSLADQMKMPEARQQTCKRDYAKTSQGWDAVLKPWLREPGDPETRIDVVYGDGKGRYDGLANIFRSIRFLETVAANSAARYKWPHPLTLKMESCGHPGTDYDDEARVVTICYETPFDFAELYRAYVQPPPVAAAAPTPAARKQNSKSR